MPLRQLIAYVTLSDGRPFTGLLRVTPLEEIFVDGRNVAMTPVEYPLTDGELPEGAPIVAPGCYSFALVDGAEEIQCFQAYVPDGTTPVTLYDLIASTFLRPP